MKNLPEDELFKALEKRLENYTEEPDDQSWDKIAAALPGNTSFGWAWLDSASSMVALFTLGFLLGVYSNSIHTGKLENVMYTENALAQSQSNKLYNQSLQDDIDRNSLPIAEHGENSTASIYKYNKNIRQQSRPRESKGISIIESNGAVQDMHHKKGYITNSNALPTNNRIITSNSAYEANKPVMIKEERNMGHINQNNLEDNINDQSSSIVKIDQSKSDQSSSLKQTDILEMPAKDSTVATALPVDLSENRTQYTDQKKDDKKEKKLHPLVYFSLTPSLSYNKMAPVKNDALNVNGATSAGIFNANRFGIGVEAGLQHRLTRKLEVAAGLSYYQQNQQITYQYVSSDNVEIKSTPDPMVFTVSPTHGENKMDYNMRNIGISAGLFYQIKEGRLQHKLGAGLQYQKGFLKSGSENAYDNSSSSYLNYQISYRIEYKISNNINLFIQPNMVHSIRSKENSSAPLTNKQYRAGVAFGLLYQF